MASGIWTAAAGAAAQSQNLDVIANNLANADTPSFKKDVTTFKEYLTTLERESGPQDIPRGPIKDKEFYPLDGRDQSFVVNDGTHTSFRQGNLRVTHRPWDIAVDGPGFLEVSTPAGIRYTRAGNLKISQDGRLTTNDGFPVLSSSVGPATANDPAARYIQLRDRGPHFTINEKGQIYSGEEQISSLSIVEFKDTNKIQKTGGLLYSNIDPNNLESADRSVIHQGMIETSNVNPVEEMTQMIRANRLYEHDLKSLKTYGELLAREANDIGKL